MERFKLNSLMRFIPFGGEYLSLIILSIFTLLLVGCGSTKEIPLGSEVNIEKTTFSFNQDAYPFDLFPEYRMMPGDVLDVLFQVRTWIAKEEFKIALDHEIAVKFIHAPELNETQRVRPDGSISLPYIGEFRVVDKTVSELKTELKKRYSKILQNPDLYIVVPEFRSQIRELKADLHTAPRGLSRLVTIRPDGYVTFPMIGDLFVANKTIPEVNKHLNEMYDKILPGLHVDLFLERHLGSVIYIVGKVNKPGAYRIATYITIIEALSLAGGYQPGANLKSIIVMRKHEKKIVATRINLTDPLGLQKNSKLFYLQPDDIVYVPKTWVSNTAEVVRDISDIIMFRGWGGSVGWSHDF